MRTKTAHMQTTSFTDIARHLTDCGTPRVWSLLVAVFGELALDRDARISGSLLRHLTEQMGVKPEAMRVALHRLRKDGWIESARTGRTSDYFLTPWGHAQSMQASPRIYAAGPAAKSAWLVLSNPANPAQLEASPGAWVSSNVMITSVPPETEEVFTTPVTDTCPLPAWMSARICDADTVRLSQDFASALHALRATLGSDPQLTSIEIAALRVLLVHSWRRIILKAPVLPDHVFPDGWRGVECRVNVFNLLDQFPKQALASLETALVSGEPR
ncbi:PaaX family transcriptional regulator C-terminal domain-containing protein [Meridianimarinicoccus sp. MJW13]|uniref:PaaX family transcriptional regulator C-terminal domain-containing protein n=1 Tax=Meridianimarinicoccus sp. MJW13 TaxID=2720031 RepID=UPI001D0084D4|nr:PaaX family transcriptional regulator C-terminal domain-containing protein [Fluviibacterium sp. MJW13]